MRTILITSLMTGGFCAVFAGVVDAITAEDLGKFPDKNVADSLARITGVSVTRGFGEGEKLPYAALLPTRTAPCSTALP